MAAIDEQALVESYEMQLSEQQEQLDSLSAQVEEQGAYLESLGMESEEEALASEASFELRIDFQAFGNAWGVVLQGMVGIFVVIVIIMAIVMLLNKITGKKKEKEA